MEDQDQLKMFLTRSVIDLCKEKLDYLGLVSMQGQVEIIIDNTQALCVKIDQGGDDGTSATHEREIEEPGTEDSKETVHKVLGCQQALSGLSRDILKLVLPGCGNISKIRAYLQFSPSNKDSYCVNVEEEYLNGNGQKTIAITPQDVEPEQTGSISQCNIKNILQNNSTLQLKSINDIKTEYSNDTETESDCKDEHKTLVELGLREYQVSTKSVKLDNDKTQAVVLVGSNRGKLAIKADSDRTNAVNLATHHDGDRQEENCYSFLYHEHTEDETGTDHIFPGPESGLALSEEGSWSLNMAADVVKHEHEATGEEQREGWSNQTNASCDSTCRNWGETEENCEDKVHSGKHVSSVDPGKGNQAKPGWMSVTKVTGSQAQSRGRPQRGNQTKARRKGGKKASPKSKTGKACKRTGSLVCKACGKWFASALKLERHKCRTMDTGGRSFICKTCGQGFTQASFLRIHRFAHTEEKPCVEESYKGNICGRELKSASKFKTHEFTHSLIKEKLHVCDICGKSFAHTGSLKIHMRTHAGEKKYECKTCGKKFFVRYRLKLHSYTHTGQRPFECKTCGKGFISAKNLRRHVATHTGEILYICETCGKGFRDICRLKNHTFTHTGEKPYVCQTCHKAFSQGGNLKRHELIHSGKKNFVCKICDKRFSRASNLKLHEHTHTGEKPYICKTCGTAYAQTSYLKSHRNDDTGEKFYVCVPCTKGVKHIINRLKNKERRFVCKTCGKRFVQKVHLKRHEYIHTGEKPYVCGTCGKAFIQKSNLKTHENKHC